MKRALTTTPSIPVDWRRAKVSDVCEFIDYGHTASANFTIGTPKFLRITDIQNGRVEWDTVPECEITGAEEEANRLHDGDIVFARTGGTTGKSFLIRQPPRAIFASYLIRLRPNHLVTSDFICAFFQSDDYWQQVNAHARGGAQPNVNAALLSNQKIAHDLQAGFVAVTVSAEKNQALTQKFRVRSYPTTVIVSPTTGVVDYMVGYVGPDEFSRRLDAAARRSSTATATPWRATR